MPSGSPTRHPGREPLPRAHRRTPSGRPHRARRWCGSWRTRPASSGRCYDAAGASGQCRARRTSEKRPLYSSHFASARWIVSSYSSTLRTTAVISSCWGISRVKLRAAW
jgi:hypothetical protein